MINESKGSEEINLFKNVLIVCCALFVTNAVAQTAPSSTPGSQSSQAHSHRKALPGGERSMKGCVVKDSSGAYFLALQRGTRVPLNSSNEMASHVGQQVRLSGDFIDAEKPDPSSSTPSGSQGTSSAAGHRTVREFNVLKVDVLAPNCPPPKKK